MSFNAQGLRQIGHGGTLSDSAVVGGTVTARLFHYITNDNEAAIETDGYFDVAYKHFNPGGADMIMISADRDGTPAFLIYGVTRTGGDIALTAVKGTG